MEATTLFVSLVVALSAALVGAIVAARLGQSVILGYILAGIALGPFTPGPIGDIATVQALADIGIIFLLFSIGVQLSLADLYRVGKVATVGGIAQVLLTIAIGYVVGVSLGWSPIAALFLGAVLSNSSSTVLGKVLGERGEVDSEHGRISLAWSSVQDFSTIVLVVVLSALAAGGNGSLDALFYALATAVVFLILVVLVGSRALPVLFERVAALRNREVFVLTIAAVALGTAYVSTLFGISLALGAFVAGVVVSESDLSHRILGEILPLRDVLAGLFFVSVGMLINPLFVVQNVGLVLLVVALIVVVKGLLVAGLTALAGYSVRTALLTGVTLAQSAEFSFLLARVGLDIGALTPDLFSLMLAGAAASIVLAPNLHQSAEPMVRQIEKRLPVSRLANLPDSEGHPKKRLRGHAVICGYGRVGHLIGAALRRQGFQFLVVDEDQRTIRRLRERGVPALLGDAANPVILERVGLERARVLVIAIPDPLAARQIVDYARQVNRRLDIVVRTHSEPEREYMNRWGVSEAVVGERELALEMIRHTLRRFGLSALETLAIVQRMRERTDLEAEDEIAA